uniref:Uncharacterized protein n=1 Tax=Cacopsylla melanoneura TaxID=428564 RepID=A0A8D8RA73_9HEMI
MYCFAIFHSKRIHLYGFPFVVYWDCLPLIHGSRSSTSGISGSSWITCCSAASSWSRTSTRGTRGGSRTSTRGTRGGSGGTSTRGGGRTSTIGTRGGSRTSIRVTRGGSRTSTRGIDSHWNLFHQFLAGIKSMPSFSIRIPISIAN